jgi:putative methionine-R-sulfoxide reductase with GAF domain
VTGGHLSDGTARVVVEPAHDPSLASIRGLDVILAEVVGSMHADMAQVLVLDETQSVLEPVASHGLGRASRGSLRVHVGAGFAGGVAEARRPVVLKEINEHTVLDPVLRLHEPKALMGVPLLDGHQLVGVLHIGTRADRDFGVDDTVRLERWAAKITERLETERFSVQQTAALVLQRSLMPVLATSVAGLEVAARYVPAEGELGGDWYDVFALPGDRVGFVMGDVAGHGLKAAVIMGRLRSALRAYALDEEDPGRVLDRLDRKISHFESGSVATVLYAVSDAPYTSLRISSAGHWPPFLAEPGREPVALEIPADLLLGTGMASRPRSTTTVEFAPGASICLFTDGLVDRRSGPGPGARRQLVDRLEAVRRSLRAEDDPETACTRILLDALGDEPNEDDVALLVVRQPHH